MEKVFARFMNSNMVFFIEMFTMTTNDSFQLISEGRLVIASRCVTQLFFKSLSQIKFNNFVLPAIKEIIQI